VPGIWAIGDVTDRINLTPVALMEGMAFAKTAFGGQLTKPDYQNVASAVFCQPPLASVGCVLLQQLCRRCWALDFLSVVLADVTTLRYLNRYRCVAY
jgi:hypothetical protein